MRFFSCTILSFLISTIVVVAQVQRPVSGQGDRSSLPIDRMIYPKDMAVKIMAGEVKSSEKSTRSHKSDCGNGGITPQELQQFEQTSIFVVNYIGFTPEAQIAFQHAVDIWSRLITAEVPIEIDVSFENLGASTLGTAQPSLIYLDVPNEPIPNTFYPSALADQYNGFDQAGADIEASFNDNISDWYFGLDACPAADEFDFVTIAVHEIAHGLGIITSAEILNFTNGPLGCYGFNFPGESEFFPTIFDHFVEGGNGDRITNFDPEFCWQELLDIYTGDDLFFNGANVQACNNGNLAQLYAPSLFDIGSSIIHFDEDAFPSGSFNSLATPFINRGEAIHNPGCSIALLRDLGYNAHGFIKVVPTLGQWSLIILFLLLPILSIVAIKNESTAKRIFGSS